MIIFDKMIKKYNIEIQQNSTNQDAGYPDWLGPSFKFVENYKKLICLGSNRLLVKYNTVLWLLENYPLIDPVITHVKRFFTVSLIHLFVG